MDHDEEQQLELEALEAIFVEDYSLEQESSPRVVKLKLLPFSGEDADEENKVGVEAQFTLPAEYPEVAPEVAVTALRGLTSKQTDELADLALAEVENLLGMAMIFQLSEVIKEWLVENNRDHTDESMHAQMLQKMQDEERAREEAEERERRAELGSDGSDDDDESDDGKPRPVDGTPVTVESFSAWEEKFITEMRAAREAEEGEKTKVVHSAKPDADLNGRQWFEKQQLERAAAAGLIPGGASAQATSDGDGGQEEDWGEGEIEEDLFLQGAPDEELDELDDLSSDEDDDDDDDEDDEE
ncbi:E3 ubiquitin-protein ligase RNF25 [Hondaea fermentalgiana]|uniref:E3 ubiquitin-protein ligase RNF25 n=1 Tax=Hondaea fermentalgiana TaxID=2315210 RepID=A0A2R5G5A0_9STRA|nr:E3 ubiquitin-protein ligase RNF25 [Hondaea fermentalgiana]|eukprot:GBG26207.1 E3 ubiquitin-protein ligase RNF25 [Hondaea fermentalgiana]